MMNPLRLVALLALLFSGAVFAQVPTAEGRTFTVTTDTQIVLCRGTVCSQPVLIKAGVLTNCGYWVFNIVADPNFSGECRAYAAAPPPTATVPPDTYFNVCFPLDITLKSYGIDHAPNGYSSPNRNAITFLDDCSKTWRTRLYSDADEASLRDAISGILYNASVLGNGTSIVNGVIAWAKTRPYSAPTAEEAQWATAVNAKYVPAPPPPPPAVTCATTRQSSTVLDRQVYKANASKTGAGTALTGVRVVEGTLCDAANRLGTTNYYSVAGQKDTMGRTIAEGWAIGAVK